MDARARVAVGRRGRTPIGEGRYRLLRSIEDTGSLSKAAASMSMSYRHAWGVIRHLEEEMGAPLVVSSRGGIKGGRTELTDLARELLDDFERASELIFRALDGKLIYVRLVLAAFRGKRVLTVDGSLPSGELKAGLTLLESFGEIASSVGLIIDDIGVRPVWNGTSGELVLVAEHRMDKSGSGEMSDIEDLKPDDGCLFFSR